MRERRRSGRLVLPATRPPAGRALPGLSTGSGHHGDPWGVLRFRSEFVEGRLTDDPEEGVEPATAAPRTECDG